MTHGKRPTARKTLSRAAALIAVAGMLAALGGCVVYPGYYGPPHGHYYWR